MFVKYCDNLSDYRFLGNLEGRKLYYCCSRGRTISTEFPYKSSSFLIARSFFFTWIYKFRSFVFFQRYSSALPELSVSRQEQHDSPRQKSFPFAEKLPYARTWTSFDIYRRWFSWSSKKKLELHVWRNKSEKLKPSSLI